MYKLGEFRSDLAQQQVRPYAHVDLQLLTIRGLGYPAFSHGIVQVVETDCERQGSWGAGTLGQVREYVQLQ